MPDNDPLKFLYSLQHFGIKLGLKNIRELMKFTGNPHTKFPTIHIAGTNGKGSTSAMLASILTASGYRTGLYTSPHLLEFNERIRINGKKISDNSLARYTDYFKDSILRTRATFFEATTAIAFKYFADHKVDIAVIETGLGGRFDATNVLNPQLSIITTIGLEHTQQLGNTLAEIAFQKGGIIKPGVPCITGVKDLESLNVLQEISRKSASSFHLSSKSSKATVIESDIFGLTLNLKTKHRTYSNLKVSLPGSHQSENARLALFSAEFLNKYFRYKKISPDSIIRGLNNIQSLSGFHGRLEIINDNPLMIIDVAHNPDGVTTALASMQRLVVNKPLVLFGVMKDKNYREMILTMKKYVKMIIAVTPKSERALDSASIVEVAHSNGIPAIDGKSVQSGLTLATKHVCRDEPILIIGSHYLVGETLEIFKSSLN